MLTKIKKLYFNTFKSKYTCPFCKNKVMYFDNDGLKSDVYQKNQMVGAGERKNARCNRCGGNDRERLVYYYLKNKTNLLDSNGLSILHIAPEKNISFILSKTRNNYIMGDKFTKGYTYPNGTIDIDITNISFEDEHFDFIICNHVLEHIPDESKAIRELFRVLKKGGKAILQVPFSKSIDETIESDDIHTEEERIMHYGQFDHVRLYGKDYSARISAHGLEVLEILNVSSDVSVSDQTKYALNINENITVYTKQ